MLKSLVSLCHCHARCSEALCRHSCQRILALTGPTRVMPIRRMGRTAVSSHSLCEVRSTSLGAEARLNNPTWHRPQVHTRCMASHAPSPSRSEPPSVTSVAPVSALYIDHLDPLNTTVVDVDLDLMRRLEDVTVLLENVALRNMSIDVCQLVGDTAKHKLT